MCGMLAAEEQCRQENFKICRIEDFTDRVSILTDYLMDDPVNKVLRVDMEEITVCK